MKRKCVSVFYGVLGVVVAMFFYGLMQSELDSRDAADRLSRVYGVTYASAGELDEEPTDWDVMGAVAIASPAIKGGMDSGIDFGGEIVRANASWAILEEAPRLVASWAILADNEPPKFVFRDDVPALAQVDAMPAPTVIGRSPVRLPVLYTSDSCVYCRPTKRALTAAGVRVREVDVSGSRMTVPAMDYMGARLVGMTAILGAFTSRAEPAPMEVAPMEMGHESHESHESHMSHERHERVRRGPLRILRKLFGLPGQRMRSRDRSSRSAPMRGGGS